jgi:hypothetical protein
MEKEITKTDFQQQANNIYDNNLKRNYYQDEVVKFKDKITDQNIPTENILLLEKCAMWYASLDDFRERRIRSRKYLEGDQWHEIITDPNDSTSTIKEEDYIKDTGKLPLKQNLIRNMYNNLMGQFREDQTKTMVFARDRDDAKMSEVLTMTLNAAHDNNETRELDVANFGEVILSGAAIQKLGFQEYKEQESYDLTVENINPTYFFFNTDIKDIRMSDLNLVGQIIDTSLSKIIASFARNKKQEKKLKDIYSYVDSQFVESTDGLTPERIDAVEFMQAPMNKCRVYEIWELRSEWRTFVHDTQEGRYYHTDKSQQEIEAVNHQRIQVAIANGVQEEDIKLIYPEEKYDEFWYVKYLTPYGHTLYEGETPYEHLSHPFIFRAYPMIDGKAWGKIEEVIDQQRHVNRIISVQDNLIAASAKGLLAIHEDSVPKGMDIEDYTDQFTKVNGVIIYGGKLDVPLPKILAQNSRNIGAQELLLTQIKMFQEVSGVMPAIQGQRAPSGTPASQYLQEAQNSSTNNRDLFEFYMNFTKNRDMKAIKIIVQFYNETRYINIAGKSYKNGLIVYEPEKVKELHLNVTVSKGLNTPLYRQMLDDTLFKLLEAQLIDLKIFLENSSLPFKDNILESIKQREEEGINNPEQMGGIIDPNQMQQLQQGANPDAMKLLEQYAGR